MGRSHFIRSFCMLSLLVSVLALTQGTCTVHAETAVDEKTHAADEAAAAMYFSDGLDKVKKERYRAAIRAFNNALSHDSTMAEAYLNIGACYERIGEFHNGIPYYENALKHDSGNPRLYYLYGVALVQNGEKDKGVKMLEQAAYLAPDNTDYLYNLGVGYASVTQYHHAAQCFEQASARLSPVPGAVWYNLGLAELHCGNTNDARAAWDKVALDAPVAPQVYYWNAQLAYAEGAVTTALHNAKMALALNPELTEARALTAAIYQQQGAYQQAADILESIYRHTPTRAREAALAELYADWSDHEKAQGNIADALRYSQQAVRYAPTDSALWIQLGYVALTAEKAEIAKDARDKSLRFAHTSEAEKAAEALSKAYNNMYTEEEKPPIEVGKFERLQ